MSTTAARAHARSLYRRVLRELPTTNHLLNNSSASAPTVLRSSIRSHFLSAPKNTSDEYALARRQEVDQAIQFLKAQRVYTVLLARYNPGADMDDEERVRLTARRVGMDMPEEWYGKGTPGKFGVEFEGKKKRE